MAGRRAASTNSCPGTGRPRKPAERQAVRERVPRPRFRFLDDGRIELDTNTVERAIRPLVLSRKNALFASGDDGGARWAAVASLVETCKLNGVDPQRYLTEFSPASSTAGRTAASTSSCRGAGPKPKTADRQAPARRARKPRLRMTTATGGSDCRSETAR